MDVSQAARKHALKNAFDYGKASAGSVVGKVIAEVPDAKKDMASAMKAINEAVNSVNSLSKEAIEKELAGYEFVEKKEEERKLRLQGAVEGSVVTRFSPEPNGFAHIGHAKAAWLSRQAAEDWNGRCLVRFDDTNPEKESEEYVEAILGDAEWLGLTFDGVLFASDFMKDYYAAAEKLIAGGRAYACTCSAEDVKKTRETKTACGCRSRSAGENAGIWMKMLDGGIPEGGAILRFKGDLASDNTVMRDPALARVMEAPHYRHGKKYRVWPNYDLQVSVADSTQGVTHALRSKEYELRDELYYAILDALGMRKPVVYDFSRLNIKGTALSKRLIKPLVDAGNVTGWDDPRLPTIRGLKRRGILPEAIRNFVLSFGLSKVESEPGWGALLTENRRLLDPVADHYFFIPEPVALQVEGAPSQEEVELASPNGRVRRMVVHGDLLIPGEDAHHPNVGDVVRLKELFTVKVTETSHSLVKAEFEEMGHADKTVKKLQWVGESDAARASLLVPGDLLMEDGSFNPDSLKSVAGVCEKSCAGLPVGTVVQFERVGFARLDSQSPLVFIQSA